MNTVLLRLSLALLPALIILLSSSQVHAEPKRFYAEGLYKITSAEDEKTAATKAYDMAYAGVMDKVIGFVDGYVQGRNLSLSVLQINKLSKNFVIVETAEQRITNDKTALAKVKATVMLDKLDKIIGSNDNATKTHIVKSENSIKTEAIKKENVPLSTWIDTGRRCIVAREYDKALYLFGKAITLAPNNAEAYTGRGMTYGKLKIYDKAILDFNTAIELNASNFEAYYHKALAYQALGQEHEALLNFRHYLELALPDDPEMEKVKKIVEGRDKEVISRR